LYEKSPPDVRAQILVKLGLKPSAEEPISPSQGTTAKDLHTIVKGSHEMSMKEKAQNLAEQTQQTQASQAQQQIEQAQNEPVPNTS
jgi:hypothetical protein